MSASGDARVRRWPLVAVVLIGLGLALAPAVFGMFTRAPQGGRMIDEFRPFMTEAKIEAFQGYLREIGRADTEVRQELPRLLRERAGLSEAEVARRFPAVTELHGRWPGIDADMSDMLRTMGRNLDNFGAVDALPPFALFPWFFVAPGLMAAALAYALLRSGRRGSVPRGGRRALAALGLAIVAAPAIFQMFERAPKGGDMINDFRPLMTDDKVTMVQGYFLVLGAAEGQLRTEVLPLLEETSQSSRGALSGMTAVTQFIGDWPRISSEMAPMIGAMADNVDNFAAVDALPPFPLFPWFFVVPGLMVTALAWGANRRGVVPGAPGPDAVSRRQQGEVTQGSPT